MYKLFIYFIILNSLFCIYKKLIQFLSYQVKVRVVEYITDMLSTAYCGQEILYEVIQFILSAM